MHRYYLRILSLVVCLVILSTNLLFAAPPLPVADSDAKQEMNTYRLSKYDVMNIVVLGMPSAASELGFSNIMVGPDGFANLPYVGSIYLSGLTIPEATELLTEKLGQYIKIPGMTIMITAYGPRQVYVMGEVVKPGIYDLRWERMNILSAISSAGGIGRRGQPKRVQVVRMVDNEIETKEINFKQLLKKGDLTQNAEVRDGDLIYVPRSGRIDFQADIMPLVNTYFLYRAIRD